MIFPAFPQFTSSEFLGPLAGLVIALFFLFICIVFCKYLLDRFDNLVKDVKEICIRTCDAFQAETKECHKRHEESEKRHDVRYDSLVREVLEIKKQIENV